MPDRETVTTDGKDIWWFIPEKKIVYQYPAGRLGKELRLLSNIFMGLSDASDKFDVTLPEPEKDDEYILKLTPKRTMGGD